MSQDTLKYVNRNSPIPAYQQIADDLIKRIIKEEWEVGDKLPPENDLAKQYEVSRVTLRQALSQLEKGGLIDKRQGRGVFVTSNPKIVMQTLQFPSLNAEQNNNKKSPIKSKDVHIIMPEISSKQVIHRLKLKAEDKTTYLRRLFYHDSMIIGVNHVWFPSSMVPDLENKGLIDLSISKTLKYRYNHEIVEIENFIESIKLNVNDANLLNTNYDSSALKIESIHYLNNLVPIEYATTIWVGGVTRFHFVVSEGDSHKRL